MAEYLDYSTPALAAGAVLKKGYWNLPGEKEAFGFVSRFCEAHNIEPIRLDPPKSRTFAAIRRESMALASRYDKPTGRDGLALRAYQYARAMRGKETLFQNGGGFYNLTRLCEFGKASDGSTRVKSVDIEGGRFDIPNWDFVASVVDTSDEVLYA